MTGRTFDVVTTGIRPNRRRFSRSCKRISGVLLYFASLHRGRTNLCNQRGQNRSHAGWARVHTRCGLGFLPQVSSNYSSLLKHRAIFQPITTKSPNFRPIRCKTETNLEMASTSYPAYFIFLTFTLDLQGYCTFIYCFSQRNTGENLKNLGTSVEEL